MDYGLRVRYNAKFEMHAKKHEYLVHNVAGKVQITLSNILSSSDISTKSQGRHS